MTTIDAVVAADGPAGNVRPGADRGVIAGLVVLAGVAATWAAAASRLVFPFGSVDHDEAVYRLQADALVHGHLFPVAPPAHTDAFLPWLSAYRAGHYVPKYAPVDASILAAGRLLSGTDRAGLALIAGAAVIATYLLGREVLGDARLGVLAAVLVVGSPIFLLQSATFLPYLTGLVLLELFAFCEVRSVRTDRPGWALLAGLCGGVALFARTYDAVLFAAPMVVAAMAATWRKTGFLTRRLVPMAIGALPPLVGYVLFNRAATGQYTKSPFGLLDSSDSIGFGSHRIYATDPYLRYTPREGLLGMVRSFGMTGFWCFGGLLLIGLCAIALARHGWRSPRWWIAVAGLAIPAGYFFFWGSYGATIFGAPRYLGPYYYLPLLAPIVVLGAAGFARLWRWDRGVAQLAAVVMTALSLFVTVRTIRADRRLSADDSRLNHALTSAHFDRAIVFLPQFAGPHLLIAFGTAMNHYGYTGKVVYALDEGSQADRAIAAMFPGRTPYVLVVHGSYRANPPDKSLTSELAPLAPTG